MTPTAGTGSEPDLAGVVASLPFRVKVPPHARCRRLVDGGNQQVCAMQPDSPEGMLVLITGACGVVGTILRYHWRAAGMTLRLADLTEPEELLPHESFMRFDLLSDSDCRRVCEGVHTIVHLAADAGSEDFLESLLPKNVVKTQSGRELCWSSGR